MPAHNRKTYKLWLERRVPCLAVDVTSLSTRRKDEKKKPLYARLGVKEYFRFDPEGEYLNPRRRRAELWRKSSHVCAAELQTAG